MGVREQLIGAGRTAIGAVGAGMLGLADNENFWKAEGPTDPEDDDHGPGGDSKDTAENAPVPEDKADSEPKALFWDPYSIIEQLGYKEKPTNITYGTLKAIGWKVPIVQAVMKERINQVAAFANHPSQDRYDMGWKFHKRGDPKTNLTPGEKKWAEQMNTIMQRTGVTDNPRGRDNFETFVRKVMKDSLHFDQLCFEVVENKMGLPAEWYAVDASTIRLADSASAYLNEDLETATRYVQIYDSMIITEYKQSELCFGIRNPTTDMRLFGYGTSELEMLMNVMTALLWGWEYNQRAFSQGSAQKGILNFKGAIPTKQLKSFRRHWYQMLSGVQNAWRTPITNADDLQWISLQQNNRDMEYSQWFDFLIKLTCAMFHMDPVEVNFKYGNTGQKAAMQGDSGNKDKIIESKERGLRPLLVFLAGCINRHIVWPINEDMEFAFVGLDAMTRDQVADLNAKRVKVTHTPNELRAEDDLEPLDGGDIILDPVYMQGLQMQQNAENAEKGLDENGQPFPEEDEDDDDFDFSEALSGANDDDEDKQTEGKGGRPEPSGKPAEANKPQAGQAKVAKSIRKSQRRKKRRPVVDIRL